MPVPPATTAPANRHPSLTRTAILTCTVLGAALAADPGIERPDAPVAAAVGSMASEISRTLRWGGYGELHYNNWQAKPQGSVNRDMLELHRLVLLAEASLHERVRLVTEIEFEHGFIQGKGSTTNASDAQGEIEIEQAYLEFSPLAEHRVRIGTMLVPISIGNLYHEPTLFHGVERPEVDRVIVPTTWYENGVAVLGTVVPGLTYQAAVQAGLDGSKFRGQDGLREGRQKGYKSSAEDLVYTGRLDWKPMPGVWVAGAALAGQGDQDTGPKANYWLWTAETRLERAGAEFAATYARGGITYGADHPGYKASGSAPQAFYGWNATLGYDVLRPFEAGQSLVPFVRYESTDVQARVPAGTGKRGASTVKTVQFGATWKPYHDVAIKFDYQDRHGDDAVDVWNLGLGFVF
jgi:hypothetical protein